MPYVPIGVGPGGMLLGHAAPTPSPDTSWEDIAIEGGKAGVATLSTPRTSWEDIAIEGGKAGAAAPSIANGGNGIPTILIVGAGLLVLFLVTSK